MSYHKDELCGNQIQMQAQGEGLIRQGTINSPSRKGHPFTTVHIPQLSLSLFLVSINNNYGKKYMRALQYK